MTDIAAALGRVTTPTLTTVMMRDHGLNNTAIRDVFACNPAARRFAGPAVTARFLPLREDLQPVQFLDHPENLMRPLVEEAPAGSVVVLDANRRNDVGVLGGNLVMRMKVRGVAAAVTDGGMRDLPELAGIDFPVFATAAVAEAGQAMDHIEGYVHKRLARGEPVPGLYPPGEQVRADYAAWVAAGEPEL